MKTKLYSFFALICAILICSSYKYPHPLKLTASLIEYNPEKENIRVECKVFIDDFEYCMNKRLNENINITALTEEDIKGIEEYFKKHYIISFNDQLVPLRFQDIEIYNNYNVLIVKFDESDLTIKKGDQFAIENTLLLEEFPRTQTNRIALRLPPFIPEYSFETWSQKTAVSYTF